MAKRKKYIFLAGALLIAILFQLSAGFIQAQMYKIIFLWPLPEKAHNTIQIISFPFITVPVYPTPFPIIITPGASTPIPGAICRDYTLKGSTCRCPDVEDIACGPIEPPKECTKDYGTNYSLAPIDGKNYCVRYPVPYPFPTTLPEGCVIACVFKPVVYLYAPKPTLVSVAVQAPGRVIVSDPLYPDRGWKDVLAHPDGTLIYKDKKYKELFYETSITKKIEMPEEGMIIKTEELEKVLRPSLIRLGLIQKEQDEFLDYWLPVLRNLHSPYIFFSVLPEKIKESVDHLVISPKPDARIEFIAYFKPLAKPITIKPLRLPQSPPKRAGFTEVEWGGTIGD